MAWERETFKTIHDRMKADAESRLTGGTKIPRYSLLGVLLLVVSGGVHLVYGFLYELSKQLFIDTATGAYLDRHARAFGLPRKAATYSIGPVQFTGTAGTVVPIGTKVQNGEGLAYSTLAETTLDGGIGAANIQADTAGSVGNTSETELILVAPIAGVDSTVLVTVAPNGGSDTEDDDALRLRLLQRRRNPPASGNVADYIRWATAVAGVERAWVKSASDYQGAGTVGVYVSTASLDPVGSTIKAAVVDSINRNRPVTAEADVLDVRTKEVKVFVDISPNTSDYRAAVSAQLDKRFLEAAYPGDDALISMIRSAVGSVGLLDFEVTALEANGVAHPVANVTTEPDQVGRFAGADFGSL